MLYVYYKTGCGCLLVMLYETDILLGAQGKDHVTCMRHTRAVFSLCFYTCRLRSYQCTETRKKQLPLAKMSANIIVFVCLLIMKG